MQQRLCYVPPTSQLGDAQGSVLPKVETRRKRTAAEADEVGGGSDSLYAELRHISSSRFKSELQHISEELARTTAYTETLAQQPSRATDTPERIAEMAQTAWRAAERLLDFSINHRYELDNEHRIAVWIARMRCISLASDSLYARFTAIEGMSSASSSENATAGQPSTRRLRQARADAFGIYNNTRRDRELFHAHAVLWPHDTREGALRAWCIEQHLLTAEIRANFDDGLRNASTHTLWRLVQVLFARWMHLPYCAQLVAYVWRLIERTAVLCAYSGTAREFNHPLFFEKLSGGEYTANERFIRRTEHTFFAIEVRLRRCAYVAWPNPSLQIQPTIAANAPSPAAVQRFEQFVGEQLASNRFRQFIEKDFEVVFFDHVLYPGEMELYEKLRPYDDRKPMSCLTRMRRFDFDRYQRMYTQPPIQDVWKSLIADAAARTHPAYMLIASRVLQYYFDSTYDGASFDSYFCALENVPFQHLRASLASALRDNNQRAVTRGSARHFLCGTLLRSGMKSTPESRYPHPVIVTCIGQYAVVEGDDSTALCAPVNFATAFLLWLQTFCGDTRLHGTFANGKTCAPLLRLLRPCDDASVRVADRIDRVRTEFENERAELTNLECSINELGKRIPTTNTDTLIVLKLGTTSESAIK
jgi:hypothetical protein